ncbi:MAG: hypothetical protein HQM08_25630 [Candidatus Riflebacteria bacterium]|nr:hypothetical protein [Candidatus Riflebacteria bacterium]
MYRKFFVIMVSVSFFFGIESVAFAQAALMNLVAANIMQKQQQNASRPPLPAAVAATISDAMGRAPIQSQRHGAFKPGIL